MFFYQYEYDIMTKVSLAYYTQASDIGHTGNRTGTGTGANPITLRNELKGPDPQ